MKAQTQLDRTPTSNRTTIRLSDDLHRRLKVLAAERGTTMQDLLEQALRIIVEGGLDQPARVAQDGALRIPPHLEPMVEAFVDFFLNHTTTTERQIRKLI